MLSTATAFRKRSSGSPKISSSDCLSFVRQKISHKELLAVDIDSHPLPLASLVTSVATTKLLLEEFEWISIKEELLATSKPERVAHHLLLLIVAHDHLLRHLFPLGVVCLFLVLGFHVVLTYVVLLSFFLVSEDVPGLCNLLEFLRHLLLLVFWKVLRYHVRVILLRHLEVALLYLGLGSAP